MDPIAVFNALYDNRILKFGSYHLKSGLVAPYYMNLRRLPLYPKLMSAIVDQVIDKFLLASAQNLSSEDSDSQAEDETYATGSEEEQSQGEAKFNGRRGEFVICGVPHGAIPLASAIALRAKLPNLVERKEAKSYGDHQSLIDDFESAEPIRVVLVEDVICSGESILDAVKKLEKQKLKVEFVICIVDREENGISLLLRQFGIKVLSLYNISAILRVLETTGRISQEQFSETRQWISMNQFESIGVDPSKKVDNHHQQLGKNDQLISCCK